MARQIAPPFLHRPYDGTSQPFTVGLKPIDDADWLEPDAFLVAHLAEKERFLAHAHDAVFCQEPETEAAQSEVLNLILRALARDHGEHYDVGPHSVRILAADRTVVLDGGPGLLTAARLVQEDLVLMRAGPEGYRLVAACLCFPSSWSLREKFGQSMTGIHDNVPGFNGARMGRMVARLFDNLKAGQLVCRFNWSLYPDGDLHHPLPKQLHFDIGSPSLSRLFLRVERQTLRRLPETGDILFTIKIHHDPLAALCGHPERQRLAGHLKEQLLALDDKQLAYKGLTGARDALAAALMRI